MNRTSCVPGRLERPRVVPLETVTRETDRHATLSFRDPLLAEAQPGTFCMVWIPGVDEIPMGLGYNDADGRVTLTVEGKGDATKALLALKSGDRMGLRGPYGQGFRLPAKGHAVFVGGGTGIAPMARGIQVALKAGLQVTLISGARNKDLLLLQGHLAGLSGKKNFQYHPCTDDGSYGFHGFTTERLEQLLRETKVDYVAACGPEKMMAKVTAICDKAGIASEASLERYMKCSTGICDACTVGPGWRVCLEGPVFTSAELKQIPEYGVGHRDASGILHPW